MRVRIHRGAAEIGGTCVEVEAGGQRLVLDVGRPLDAERGQFVPLPDVPGLADGSDPTLLGLLVSHGHQDHWGLIDQVSEEVPVYIGTAAANILREAMFFTGAGVNLEPKKHYEHRTEMQIGPFTVTPYLNDHNGYDAYSLLIEAEGKRLFYSADFQGHGRKAALFQEMLRKPPTGVDVMLMEGTNVREHSEEGPELTEAELEDVLVKEFKDTPGLALMVYSGQSIDRLVTIYRAALQSDRSLVMDLYTATIAAATRNKRIPQAGPDWDRVLVYVPHFQRVQVAKAKEFHRVDRIKDSRIYPEEICRRGHELVMTFRKSMVREFEDVDCFRGARAIWSMWPGYRDEPDQDPLKTFLDQRRIPLLTHHASGHAYLDDLKQMARAVNPRRLVPIHSFAGDRFVDHFDNVDRQADGVWWEV